MFVEPIKYWMNNPAVSEVKFINKKSSNISRKSKFKKNICYTTFTKKIGFNPSIVALILFEKEIKNAIEEHNDKFLSCTKFWPPNKDELLTRTA